MLLAAMLSPALLQPVDCDTPGNANLASLEVEAAALDRVVGFASGTSTYDVWTPAGVDIITVRATAVAPGARVNYRLAAATITSGFLGFGGGEQALSIPADTPVTLTLDVSDGGTRRSYLVRINQPCSPGECDDADPCTTDVCTASSCEFGPGPDGAACGIGGVCSGGACVAAAVTQSIPVQCLTNVFTAIAPLGADFELTVDPATQAIGGAPFDADLTGVLNMPEQVPSGVWASAFRVVTRIAIGHGSIAVTARSGATGPDVPLQTAPAPTTCALDGNGARGLSAGPFPSCDPANDFGTPTSQGYFANSDCDGGGAPATDNPCLPFRDLTIIDGSGDNCAACSALDPAPGGVYGELCNIYDVCSVLDDLAFPLETVTATFTAEAGATEGLFGFEESTVFPPIYIPGPFDGFNLWYEFEEVSPPASGPQPWQCFMAADATNLPVPDSELISIPIE